MKKKTAGIIAGATVLTAVAAGTGYAVADKQVDVTADGQTRQVHTFGSTVADALQADGVTVGPHDSVVPGPDSRIQDGSHITVAYGRPLTLTLNGTRTVVWTTATSLDEALRQVGIGSDARLSVSRSQAIGRQGLDVVAVTPKRVTLTVGTARPVQVTSTADTVADLLDEQKVTLSGKDTVVPKPTTPITDALAVRVTRVVVTTSTVTTPIKHTTVTTNDPLLADGTRKVTTPGVDGKTVQTIQTTTTNGKQTARTVVSTVTTQPVAEQVSIGTKAPEPTAAASPRTDASSSSSPTPAATSGSAAGLDLSREAMWDRIAQCESSGDWSLNDGSGYYGGLQFDRETWLASGGAQYAPTANLASRAQQITIANKLYAERGLQPWACAHAA